MAQYQKDEVRERIVEAALAVLAERGFAGASIAEIARRAGVATGNVYRYFPGKEALFEAAVPESFVASMRAVLRKRVRALAGVVDASGPPSPAFAAATADLFRFLLEHRLRIVVALGRAEGTRWDGLRDELVDELVTLAIAHFRELDPALRVTEALLPLMREDGTVVMVSSGMGELSCVSPALQGRFLAPDLDLPALSALMREFVDDVAHHRHREHGWPSSAYRVSKVGLNALTRVLAREHPKLRINAVCPGWVRTDMGGRSAPREVREGAASIVWAALLRPNGPTGGFFRDGQPIDW